MRCEVAEVEYELKFSMRLGKVRTVIESYFTVIFSISNSKKFCNKFRSSTHMKEDNADPFVGWVIHLRCRWS